MAFYKKVKNGVAHYIKKDEVIANHENGYIVIKEIDDADVIRVAPSEDIPEEFFIEEDIK